MEQRPLTPEGASRLGTEGDTPPPQQNLFKTKRKTYLFFKDQINNEFKNTEASSFGNFGSENYTKQYLLDRPPLTTKKMYILQNTLNNYFLTTI